MGWLLSIGIALLTGLVSLFGSAFAAEWCTRWFEVSEREGGRGYAVVFLALFGGLVGCILGLVVARLVAGSSQPSGGRALGFSLLAVVGLLGLVMGFSYLTTEHTPEIDGLPLDLRLEVRFPEGAPKPEFAELRKWQVYLFTENYRSYRYLWLQEKDVLQADGRWLAKGDIALHSRRPGRRLRLGVEGRAETQEIVVPYAGTPTRADEQWSGWVAAPLLGGELRYRLRIRQPAPPPAEPVDPVDEQFAALNEQSPLEEWLPHVITTVPGRSAKAVAMVQKRIPELSRCILDGTPEIQRRALRTIALLSDPPAELAEPVREIGRRLRGEMERYLALPVDDPVALVLEDSIRETFGEWMYAVAQLQRARRLDGVAEFRAVEALAERRPEQETMQNLLRVSRHFLTEWAKPVAPGAGG